MMALSAGHTPIEITSHYNREVKIFYMSDTVNAAVTLDSISGISGSEDPMIVPKSRRFHMGRVNRNVFLAFIHVRKVWVTRKVDMT